MSAKSQPAPALEAQQLLDAARQNSAASRTALVESIGDIFVNDNRSVSDRERALMGDILCRLIADVETSVRAHLAARLAERANAPEDLIRLLAHDEIAIAKPILLNSKVLHDPELIAIIKTRTAEHQLAIAMRKSVSEEVSGCLVDHGTPAVINALLANENARISALTIDYLVEQSRRVDSYQGPLLGRAELGPDLARRMHAWVGNALKDQILQQFDLDPAELAEDAAAATYQAVTDLSPDDTGATDRLAQALAKPEKVKPKLLIDMLKQGEVALFDAMLGKGCGLDPNAVHPLVFDPDPAGLCIACRVCDIPLDAFDEIFRLTRKANADTRNATSHGLTELYTNLDIATARGLLGHWQSKRDFPAFVAAVRAHLGAS